MFVGKSDAHSWGQRGSWGFRAGKRARFAEVAESFLGLLPSANIEELATLYNGVEGCGDAETVRLKLRLHLGEERLVGKLDGATESKPEQFPAELMEES